MDYSYVFVKTLSENYSGKDILTLHCLVPEDMLSMEQDFINTLGHLGNVSVKFVCSKEFTDMQKFGKLHGSDYISSNAWHRIFIPSLFVDFDTAIYIDSDTMVMRDIDPLLSFETNSKFAAFIENTTSMPSRVFGTPDRAYFNAGVFIADLNYWRNSGIKNRMIEMLDAGETTKFLDQDMLNLFFNPVISPLPITFNYPAWYDENHNIYINNPIIVHFVGNAKPWQQHDEKSILPKRWRQKHLEITGVDLELLDTYNSKADTYE